MFTYEDCALHAFQEPITALADQPAMHSAELKRRFQAPAEEVRLAHNALCSQVEKLVEIVNGIVTQTFEGVVNETMLDAALADKINSKASVDALTQTDEAVAQLAALLNEKNGVVSGYYIGDATSEREIELGFRPSAVLVLKDGLQLYITGFNYGAMAVENRSASNMLAITDNGFLVRFGEISSRSCLNENGSCYHYIAIY